MKTITKEQALELLHAHLKNPNLRRHCYAVAAAMKALAVKLNGDAAKWEAVGLLHDGDYELSKDQPEKHTLLMHQWLSEGGFNDPEILNAILSHNFAHTGGNSPANILEWSLYCCDELTGFIIAVALVRPEKKLSVVTIDAVQKKWNQKAFAAGVDRHQIEQCREKLSIPVNDFIGIVLVAMQEIHEDLGL